MPGGWCTIRAVGICVLKVAAYRSFQAQTRHSPFGQQAVEGM
jgi:hypothetical protein